MFNGLNKKSVSAIIIYSIVAFVYAVCFTVIPFPKNYASYVCFWFTLIGIGAGLMSFGYAFQKGGSMISKVYGFPIFRIGSIYMVVQFLVGVVICTVGSFVNVPYWVAVVVSVILLAATSIAIIATDNTRDMIEENEKERAISTAKVFSINIQVIIDACTDEEVKGELEDLADEFKYSDPASCDVTEEVERDILEQVKLLEDLVRRNDQDAALEQIEHVSNLLNERNRICKAFR